MIATVIRFTMSGNCHYYGSTNRRTWFRVTPEIAARCVENGAELELT